MNGEGARDERAAILDGLRSRDEEVRRLAVEQVLLLPTEEAAEQLYTSLGDASWRVRKAAVERAVACREDGLLQERLVEALSDGENPGRRNSAFEALVACGTRVTSRLVEAMASEDVDVRKLAVDALAAIGDPAARPSLEQGLADPDPNVRASACEALAVVAEPADAERLLQRVVDEAEEILVRLSALGALTRMEATLAVDRLSPALDHTLLRPAAFELLGYASDEASIDTLLKGLESRSRAAREGAMAALLRVLSRCDDAESDRLVDRFRGAAAAGSDWVEKACARIPDADLARRMVLIQFLGLLDEDRAVVPILVGGRDEAVEELADRTLEGLGETAARALDEDWSSLDHDLRQRACVVLGRIGGETAEVRLARALADPDSDLRLDAARALGRGGFFARMPDLVYALEAATRVLDPEAAEEIETLVAAVVELVEHPCAEEAGIPVRLVELLASRLGGAGEPLRLAIAQVLVRVGRAEDGELLALLSKDASADVRKAAVLAFERFPLDQVHDSLRLALVDEASSVRVAAVTVLGRSGQVEATADLLTPVDDEDPRVGAAALRALGRLRAGEGDVDAEIEPFFRSALEREPIPALAALDALTELGSEAAAKIAMHAVERTEPDVVRAAIACAGSHGDESTLASLLPQLSHSDWSVRAAVVEVLLKRRYRKGLPALLRRLEVEDDPFVRETALRAVEQLEE